MSDARAISAPKPGVELDVEEPARRPAAVLAIGTLGVVYGDIGASPLYAFKQCFWAHIRLLPPPKTCWASSHSSFGLSSSSYPSNISLSSCGLTTRGRRHCRARRIVEPLAIGAMVSTARLDATRTFRSRAPLWGRHHHAGDLSIERGRGLKDCNAGLRSIHRALCSRDIAHSLCVAAPGHLEDRRAIWPDHTGLVCYAWLARAQRPNARSSGTSGHRSGPRDQLPDRQSVPFCSR